MEFTDEDSVLLVTTLREGKCKKLIHIDLRGHQMSEDGLAQLANLVRERQDISLNVFGVWTKCLAFLGDSREVTLLHYWKYLLVGKVSLDCISVC